jgi:DNA-binding transcriptional LysR family regulator
MLQRKQRLAALAQHAQESADGGASWENLRAFLLCAEHGSFRKAADALHVTSTTIMRRIERLEQELEFSLFTRDQSGLRLTDDGRAILDDAREMERTSVNLQRHVRQRRARSSGVVRFGGNVELLVLRWIIPQLTAAEDIRPLLTFDSRLTPDSGDDSHFDCDIMIGFDRPSELDLVVRRLGRLHRYPYVTEAYASTHGIPQSTAELRRHQIVQRAGIQSQFSGNVRGRVFDAEAGNAPAGIRVYSNAAAVQAAERGVGCGLMANYAILLNKSLIPVDIGITDHADIWMSYRPDLKRSDRHMAVVEQLRRMFERQQTPCFQDELIHPNALKSLMKLR